MSKSSRKLPICCQATNDPVNMRKSGRQLPVCCQATNDPVNNSSCCFVYRLPKLPAATTIVRAIRVPTIHRCCQSSLSQMRKSSGGQGRGLRQFVLTAAHVMSRAVGCTFGREGCVQGMCGDECGAWPVGAVLGLAVPAGPVRPASASVRSRRKRRPTASCRPPFPRDAMGRSRGSRGAARADGADVPARASCEVPARGRGPA